jgi:hypothetical protein
MNIGSKRLRREAYEVFAQRSNPTSTSGRLTIFA